jgi:hypothetical protein
VSDALLSGLIHCRQVTVQKEHLAGSQTIFSSPAKVHPLLPILHDNPSLPPRPQGLQEWDLTPTLGPLESYQCIEQKDKT